jgi:hypothetical protein
MIRSCATRDFMADHSGTCGSVTARISRHLCIYHAVVIGRPKCWRKRVGVEITLELILQALPRRDVDGIGRT